MLLAIVTLIALFFAAIAGFVLSDWRWKLGALAVQYLAVFLLVAQSWPLGLAAIKWITGWIACAILAYTELVVRGRARTIETLPTGAAFRLLAAALAVLVVFALAPQLITWAQPVNQYQALGGLLLIGIGLVGVGLGQRILSTIIGLLSIFAGFEVIYAALEVSSLLAGLLALINLGIAMVGAYLIVLPELEFSE